MSNTKTHHGKAAKRIREFLGLTQDDVADGLGSDWDQKKVSRLEEKEVIDDELMGQIARILNVPVEAIKNFDEERAIQIISNTFEAGSISHNGGSANSYSTLNFNPIDKYVEAVEEIKKLYEQLLQSEREKVAILEKMIQDNQLKKG